jgi:hypothetical protein
MSLGTPCFESVHADVDRAVQAKPRVTGMIVAAIVLVLLLAVCAPALATTGHGFTDQFGAPGNEEGQFGAGGPSGIAVLSSSGDVFVSDPAHTLGDLITPDPRVERFDASGAYQSSFPIDSAFYGSPGALAVDPSGLGSVYVAATELSTGAGVVLKYSAAGVFDYALDASASTTAINAGAGIAVDPSDGTVYVTATDTSTGAQVIDTFDGATGAFVSELDGSSSPEAAFYCPTALALGGGDVYVLDPCKNRVDEYSTAGVFGQVVDDGSRGAPVALTADPTSGEPFVGEAGGLGLQVTQFTAGGVTPGQSFGPPNIAGLSALAVNHSTGTVYAADNGVSVVERFTTFEGPTVQTVSATSIDPTSETLTGTINPEGVSSTYHFDYGLDTNYGAQTAESEPLNGVTEVPATATAGGLLPNTTYHFRIVGTNASGSITGDDETFTTAPAPPTLDGQPAFASAITTTGATLNATLNPNSSDTTYHFEFGASGPCDVNLCASTPDADAGAGAGDQPVTADLTGLLVAGTTYHYRLVADNGTGGQQDGADGTFSTAPAGAGNASSVSVFGAELHGTINPHGAATTYHFEYGTTTEYGRSTPEVDGGTGGTDQLVSQPTGRLTPETTYHVRVVATTNGQTTTGDDGTFTTGAMPAAVLSEPTGVTTTEAILGATVDTHGLPGTYHFQVSSLSGDYSSTTNALPTPSGSGPQPVSAQLSGLPPGESFLVVLSVTSNQATTTEQISFDTAPLQAPPARPTVPGGPYGCNTPAIDPYNPHPQAGSTITVSGHDLGVGGDVALGGVAITPTNWSPNGFSITVPHDAKGTLALTVNCGHASNTIAVTIKAPANTFTITKATINGSTATLSLNLPGPGKLATTAKNTLSQSTTVTKAGTNKLTVRLSRAGRKALKKARRHKLKLSVRVTYTPTGGTGTTHGRTLTFKTGSKR